MWWKHRCGKESLYDEEYKDYAFLNFKLFLLIFREKRKGEEHWCKDVRVEHQLADSDMPRTGDQPCNMGMWPDQESNQKEMTLNQLTHTGQGRTML